MRSLLFILLLAGIAISCSQQPKTEGAAGNGPPPVERETSELVILMRQMETHIAALKERQTRGDTVLSTDFKDYSGMLTLATTPGMNRDAAFEANANDWMNRLKELTESPGQHKRIYTMA